MISWPWLCGDPGQGLSVKAEGRPGGLFRFCLAIVYEECALDLVVTGAKRGGSMEESSTSLRSLTRGVWTTVHISGGCSRAGCLSGEILMMGTLTFCELREASFQS